MDNGDFFHFRRNPDRLSPIKMVMCIYMCTINRFADPVIAKIKRGKRFCENMENTCEKDTYSPGGPCIKCVMGLQCSTPCNLWKFNTYT